MGPVTSTELADAERAQARSDFIRSSNRRIWRIVIIACAAILGLGLATVAVIQGNNQRAHEQRVAAANQRRDAELAAQQAADLACVKKWADTYTARADRLNRLSQPRADALDDLVASVPSHNQALFNRRLNEYLAASARYKTEQRANPLPPSPIFACGIVPRKGPTPYAPGDRKVPIPSPGRTSTHPGHALPAPSPGVAAGGRDGSTSARARATAPAGSRTVTRTVTSPGRPPPPVPGGILCSPARRLLPPLRLPLC